MKQSAIAAFFDFDKTLLMVESAKPGLKYLYENGEISMRFILKVIVANYFYQRNILSEERMSRLLLGLYAGKRLADFEAGAKAFYRDCIRPLLAPAIVNRVNKHREKGHLLVLVSASVRYYLQEAVDDLGFDHLLCTDLEVGPGGLLIGRADGPMCIDAEKRRQAAALAEEKGIDLASSYAYGNHQSDIPILSLVGRPHAVEPTAPLRRTALKKGWPILSFHV